MDVNEIIKEFWQRIDWLLFYFCHGVKYLYLLTQTLTRVDLAVQKRCDVLQSELKKNKIIDCLGILLT